jgi:uncharacterized membrane protein
MAAVKFVVLVFGLLLVLYLAGLFGPGPLIPGLSPLFDQIGAAIVLTLLALVAAPLLTKSLRKTGPSSKSEQTISTPEEILRVRYARGEINREQFLIMREDLQGGNPKEHDDKVQS